MNIMKGPKQKGLKLRNSNYLDFFSVTVGKVRDSTNHFDNSKTISIKCILFNIKFKLNRSTDERSLNSYKSSDSGNKSSCGAILLLFVFDPSYIIYYLY